jgi:predicted dehydrogenase
MAQLGFGIVGTGMIAGVVADALAKSNNAKLVAVSGRQIATAEKFVENRAGVVPVQGHEALLARPDVQAVYVATPTAAKEAIALAALAANKHVLLDKPFIDHASIVRISETAAQKKLLLMDATHFVHHPRTAAIKAATAEKIGMPRSLHTAFYFPLTDRNNIRFNVEQEPTGALGDMAWYSMRAVVEYLRPEGPVTNVVLVPERDPDTKAIVRAHGLIAFAGGEVSTFDVGYTSGAILMDLQLVGTTGVIGLDDFVLDWAMSWAFESNPENKTGYTHRTGMASRAEIAFVPTPSTTPQQVVMLDNFAEIAASGNELKMREHAAASIRTQEYLDALWVAMNTTCKV